MKFTLALTCLWVASLAAQTAPPGSPVTTDGAASSATSNASPSASLANLERLQAAAAQTSADIDHLRIEKWKADAQSKQQARSNADSIQRNLTAALPGLIAAVRAEPQNLAAGFKLYRNLNALHDVLGSLTESTGAFGSRSDYEGLTQQYQTIGSVQRDLGESLERMATSMQLELNQLRTQLLRARQMAAPPPPPKKVVVDDTAPASKPVRKKKTPASSSGAATDQSGSTSGTAATPKS